MTFQFEPSICVCVCSGGRESQGLDGIHQAQPLLLCVSTGLVRKMDFLRRGEKAKLADNCSLAFGKLDPERADLDESSLAQSRSTPYWRCFQISKQKQKILFAFFFFFL